MLRENCIIGMKVTTIGDTLERPRSDSATCKEEKKTGYVIIKYVYENGLEVSARSYVAPFRFDQVHPYFGGM